jgi:hypothetical protein
MVLVVLTVIAGIVLGYLRSGRLLNLGDTELRLPALIGLAVAGQVGLAAVSTSAGFGRTLLLIGVNAALLAFAWANRMLPGMGLVMLGFAMNAAVIVANGGMPVAPSALAAIGESPAVLADPRHRVMEPGDPLGVLGDVLPVPVLGAVYSIGDVTLAAGTGTLVANLMCRKRAAI